MNPDCKSSRAIFTNKLIKIKGVEMVQPLSMDQSMIFNIRLEIVDPEITDDDFKRFLAILKEEIAKGLEEVVRNDIFMV